MPRKPNPVDLRLLHKIGKLYYEQKLTQQEISERLRLSRPKVSRLLQRAEEEGLIQITVLTPPGSYAEIEHQLESRFGLKEAVVVEVERGASSYSVLREIGQAAADYLQRTLEPGDIIGLSWGTTLNAVVNALQPVDVRDIHVVQMIGGLGAPEAEVHATDLCRRIARLLNAKLTLIPAPGIASNMQIKEALLSELHVQAALDLFSRVRVAFVGIGVPTPTSVLMRDSTIMPPDKLEVLLSLGAVGDIGLHFFDTWGNPVDSSLDELVIGASRPQMQNMERVVGVAGGIDKLAAIFGALSGGWLDVLITDSQVANSLITYQPDV